MSSIRNRTFALFVVPSFLLVALGAMLGYQRVSNRVLDASVAEATAAAAAAAADFSATLGRLAQQATATALHLELQDELPPDDALFDLLEANVVTEPLVYGAAFGFAPQVLEGRSLFAPYVHEHGQGVRRIDIGAESYDYTQPEWEWYAGPATDGGSRWTAPYFDTDAGGIVMVTYSAPIRRDGRFAGVATVDVPMSDVPEQLQVKLPNPLRLLMLDGNTTVVWDSTTPISDDPQPVAMMSSVDVDADWAIQAVSPIPGAVDLPDGTFGAHDQTALYAPISDTPWHLVAVLDRGAIVSSLRWELLAWATGGFLVFLALGLVAWRAAGSSRQRMFALAQQASAIASGDYEVRVDDSEDELGEVARALNHLGRQLADREAAAQAAQQRRFGDLVDASPRGTLLLDSDQRIVFANRAALQLLAPQGGSLEGRPLSDLLGAKVLESHPDGLPIPRRGDRSDLGQVELVDEDGRIVPVHADFAGIGDADEVDLAVLSFRDLREELRAAGVLAERERFLAGIFQNAGVGIVVTDPDGTIRDANVTFREYVGRDLVGLLGRPFAELLHPEEQGDGGRILAALGRGALNGFVTEHRYLREGGSISWGETRSAALRDNNDQVERVIVAVTDLTARRRANATFRAVFEHSDDGYLILRRDRVDDANAAALSLFGVQRVEDLSMPLLSSAHAPETQPSGLESDILGPSILENAWSGTTHRGEWEILRPDGTPAPVGLTLVPIEIGDDSALLGVVHDLTQRKRYESDLVDARDEAESAARAKADFLATMSHEIRTPMNGVIGMIDLLGESQLTADQQRMINTTKDSALALLAIINDILDFSKIEAGKLELEKVPVGVHELVDAVVEMLGTNAANAGLSLQGVVEPSVPDAIVGDPVRLRQVLFNLIGNAIKFTPHGGVTVRATAREGVDGPMLRLAIEDTGIGMTPEQVARLFQPFTQAESSTTRRFGGTGLGLSIVLRLVSLMGGTVSVESTVDHGSSFNVDIPLVPTHHETSLPDLGGLHVLVCAEGSPELETVLLTLARGGAQVEAVDSAGLTVRLRQPGRPPDVVYLGSRLDPVDRVRARGLAATEAATVGVAFVAGLPAGASIEAPDLPDTTMVTAAPLTRDSLFRAIALATGRLVEAETIPAEVLAEVTRNAAIAAGQLLLVAEDNRTNQEVIRRQLQLLGYWADVVADGRLAIQALETDEYAALLTDCHMPNVDGFELTHWVRDREATTGGRLPIIAITANALQGEGDRCLAEGMDDYLTKPLELPRLTASLTRWVGPPRGATMPQLFDDAPPVKMAPTAGAAAGLAAGDEPILDVSILETTLRGDRATARMLLADFVPNAQVLVTGARAAFEQGDRDELVRVGHTLKSSARAVGAMLLGRTCEELEGRARANPLPSLGADVDRLEEVFSEVQRAVEDTLVAANGEGHP